MRPPALVRPLLAAGMLSACGDATPPLRAPVTCAGLDPCALVTFAWDARPDTMVVLVTDAATIAAAHAYVATSSGPSIPSGPIVRGAGSDPRLPFHYVPDSVRLVEVAIELCDGRLMRTEAELNEYFSGATGDASASRAQFCPWGARPVRVDEGT